MINYSSTDIVLATIGLVGILGTAVIVAYSTIQNRKEEVKAQHIRRTRRLDQEILGLCQQWESPSASTSSLI